MRVATKEFFLLCILAVAYLVLVLVLVPGTRCTVCNFRICIQESRAVAKKRHESRFRCKVDTYRNLQRHRAVLPVIAVMKTRPKC